jgi:hypothetical protein
MNGMNNIFLWNQTKFVEKGRPIGPETLREGERINILYPKEERQLLAQTVMVGAQQDEGATPHVPKNNLR